MGTTPSGGIRGTPQRQVPHLISEDAGQGDHGPNPITGLDTIGQTARGGGGDSCHSYTSHSSNPPLGCPARFWSPHVRLTRSLSSPHSATSDIAPVGGAVSSHGFRRRHESRAGPSLHLHGHRQLRLCHRRHPLLRPDPGFPQPRDGRLCHRRRSGKNRTSLPSGEERPGGRGIRRCEEGLSLTIRGRSWRSWPPSSAY